MNQLVLVVEDDPLWSRVLERRLKAAGYLVECLPNGRAALQWLALAQPPPDLILTDLLMPEADGYALCAGVRGDLGMTQLPIVVMSALDEPGVKSTLSNLQVFRYLLKPVAVDDLIKAVSDALMPRNGVSSGCNEAAPG